MAKIDIKWDIGKKADVSTIREIEKRWGIKFPQQYVDIVIDNDGGTAFVKNNVGEWKLGQIDVLNWKGRTAGFTFLRFSDSNSIDDIRMSFAYRMSKDYLPRPDKIFPFGETGGGDLFLFDYRKNSDVPEIIFLDHENAVTEDDLIEDDFEVKSLEEWLEGNFHKVSNSFREFLESMYPSK